MTHLGFESTSSTWFGLFGVDSNKLIFKNINMLLLRMDKLNITFIREEFELNLSLLYFIIIILIIGIVIRNNIF